MSFRNGPGYYSGSSSDDEEYDLPRRRQSPSRTRRSTCPGYYSDSCSDDEEHDPRSRRQAPSRTRRSTSSRQANMHHQSHPSDYRGATQPPNSRHSPSMRSGSSTSSSHQTVVSMAESALGIYASLENVPVADVQDKMIRGIFHALLPNDHNDNKRAKNQVKTIRAPATDTETSRDNVVIDADPLAVLPVARIHNSNKMVTDLDACKIKLDIAVQLVSSDSHKLAQDKADKILDTAQEVIAILDNMKNVHPVLGAITSTFTVIIKIEIERRENDSRVAKLHLTMTDFLVVLGSLTATFQVAVSLQELLERFLQSVCVTMNEFRDVCQAYYSLGTLGHLAQAIKYKTKFAAFKTAFDEHKKQLQDLLGSNTATTLTSMNGTVDRLDRNVQQLVMQNQQLAMQNQQLLTKIREN